VLEGGASRPRSRDRSLLNTVTVIKAKGRRARRRGPPGSR
jgi:hypothetical protein